MLSANPFVRVYVYHRHSISRQPWVYILGGFVYRYSGMEGESGHVNTEELVHRLQSLEFIALVGREYRNLETASIL